MKWLLAAVTLAVLGVSASIAMSSNAEADGLGDSQTIADLFVTADAPQDLTQVDSLGEFLQFIFMVFIPDGDIAIDVQTDVSAGDEAIDAGGAADGSIDTTDGTTTDVTTTGDVTTGTEGGATTDGATTDATMDEGTTTDGTTVDDGTTTDEGTSDGTATDGTTDAGTTDGIGATDSMDGGTMDDGAMTGGVTTDDGMTGSDGTTAEEGGDITTTP